MLSPQQTRRFVLGTMAAGLVFGLACFWWLCAESPGVAFLSKHAPAEWILYPKPPDGAVHRAAELSAVFRRSFTIDHTPVKVMLSVRAFKRFEVRINGLTVDASVGTAPDWKTPSELDVSGTLHAGTNEVSVRVTNNSGPPALWLALQADAFRLNTGEDWEASLAGAVWSNTREASQPMPFVPGNPFFGGENSLNALAGQWRLLLVFAVISAAIALVGVWWSRHENGIVLGRARHSLLAALRARASDRQGTARPATEAERKAQLPAQPGIMLGALVIVAILWAALFINNVHLLPRRIGFDVDGHLEYIAYIQTHHALPLANDGWEMCQPPLYYLVSAALLSPLNEAATSENSVRVLRIFGLAVGLGHCALIFLSLRLLFPAQLGKQCFGLLLAGFLPEHLYISHYVTNEALAAFLVSCTLYFCLRILVLNRGTWQLFLAVGLCLGAALLTKITALFAAPFVFGALCVWLLQEIPRRQQSTPLVLSTGPDRPINQAPGTAIVPAPAILPWPSARLSPSEAARGSLDARWWLRTLGVAVVATLAVCGWHYLRVWKNLGSPIVYQWDTASGFAWWSDEGFETGAYLTRFGASLVHPFYSVFQSFGDGLYSTLWGDGLCGSVVRLDRRPPWNYQLMAAGFLLSSLPAAAVLTGAIVTAVRFLRRPEPISFLLLGVPAMTLAALVYMNLKVPFYCQVKAFYCLAAILPLCLLGAIGWDTINRAASVLRPLFCVWLGVWAIDAYFSFWIDAAASATQTTRAWYLAADGRNEDAAGEFSKVLLQDPHDSEARKGLGMCLWQQEHLAEAKTQTVQALRDSPADAEGHLQLASILARQNQLPAAVEEARRAADLAPDMAEAYLRLCGWLSRLKRWPEAITTGREGLRIEPMSAELHLETGGALTALGDHAAALIELRSACEFKPTWAEAHDRFGLSLAALNQWAEAANEFDAACALKPDEASLYHLALAEQAISQDSRAIQAYRQALRLNPDLLPALNNLASILATHANPQLRNGPEAVRLAEHAAQINGGNTAPYRTTLAAAYAEAGRYSEAITAANQALTLALEANQNDLANTLRQQLELYRANRAYHQAQELKR